MPSDFPVFRSTGTSHGRHAPPAWMMAPALDIPPEAAAPLASVPLPKATVPPIMASPATVAPIKKPATPTNRSYERKTSEGEATGTIRPWKMRDWE